MKKVSTLILASPFPQSSSEKIARQLEASLSTDWTFEEIDLSTLPADDLLLRTKTPSEKFNHSVKQIMDSDLIIIATPTYRATYTGLLKVFFDLLPQDCLKGKTSMLIQTGGSPDHFLSIEMGLVPLVRSLGSNIISQTIYASPLDWDKSGEISIELSSKISSASIEIQKQI